MRFLLLSLSPLLASCVFSCDAFPIPPLGVARVDCEDAHIHSEAKTLRLWTTDGGIQFEMETIEGTTVIRGAAGCSINFRSAK